MRSRYHQDFKSSNSHYPIQQKEISTIPSYSQCFTLQTPQVRLSLTQQAIPQSRPIQQGSRGQLASISIKAELYFNSNPEPLFENIKVNSVKNSYSQKFIPQKSEPKKIAQPFRDNYSREKDYKDYPRISQNGNHHQEKSKLQNVGTIKRTTIERKRPTKTQNCLICFDPIYDKEPWVQLTNCDDIFHCECLEKELQIRIDERSFPLKCPQCRKILNTEDIKYTLQTDRRYLDKFEKYSFQAFVDRNPEKFDRCQTPNCDFASPKNPSQMRFDCPKCRSDYCKYCQVKWTIGHLCSVLKRTQGYYADKNRNQQDSNYDNNVQIENQKRQTERWGFTDQEFKNYANEKGYKPCPKCQIMIERVDGCPQVTCYMCKTMLCILSGQYWGHCRCEHH